MHLKARSKRRYWPALCWAAKFCVSHFVDWILPLPSLFVYCIISERSPGPEKVTPDNVSDVLESQDITRIEGQFSRNVLYHISS